MADQDGLLRIAEISNPAEVDCRLWAYRKSLSELDIRLELHNPENQLVVLTFVAVRYLNAPVFWRGAQLVMGPAVDIREHLASDETSRLMLDAGHVQAYELGAAQILAARYVFWQPVSLEP